MANDIDTTKEAAQKRSRVLSGVVVSDKMKDTVVVEVTRYVKHPKYKKFVKQFKRYKAHDESGEHAVGDKVRIESCRPTAKTVSFRVIK